MFPHDDKNIITILIYQMIIISGWEWIIGKYQRSTIWTAKQRFITSVNLLHLHSKTIMSRIQHLSRVLCHVQHRNTRSRASAAMLFTIFPGIFLPQPKKCYFILNRNWFLLSLFQPYPIHLIVGNTSVTYVITLLCWIGRHHPYLAPMINLTFDAFYVEPLVYGCTQGNFLCRNFLDFFFTWCFLAPDVKMLDGNTRRRYK